MHTYSVKYGQHKQDTVTFSVNNIYANNEVYAALLSALGGVETIAALCLELVVADMFQVVG